MARNLAFYSPNRRVRNWQIAGDIFVVFWCLLWVYFGFAAHRLINKLADVGTYLGQSGHDLTSPGADTGGFAKALTSPFGSLGSSLSTAGSSQVTAVHHLALAAGLVIALGPTVPVIAYRILMRTLWSKAAGLLRTHHADRSSQQLLAQRALIHQPLPILLRISDDPLADVTAGNFAPYAELEQASIRRHTGQR